MHVRNATSHLTLMAVVVATGIAADGSGEVLGLDIGDQKDEVFWRRFLRSLRQRGLGGVKLVLSEKQGGLIASLIRAFQDPKSDAESGFACNLLAKKLP